MKVLAVNSSARAGSYSRTGVMLDALVEGMRDAGAEVDVFNTKDLKIRSCQGCFTCWTKTPGKCAFTDDMSEVILPKLWEADLIVLASPLYIHSLNGAMHTFVERLVMPSAQPYFEQKENGQWSHPLRHKLPGAVVLSVCGFPEKQAFTPLMAWVDHHFGKLTGSLWAAIYRAGAENLAALPEMEADILAATRQGGRELVESHSISPETMALIEQPVCDDMALLSDMVACFWDTCIDNHMSPKQVAEKQIIPRPKNLRQFMAMLTYGFNPNAAEGADLTMQFELGGDQGGVCHFVIRDKKIKAVEGPAPAPSFSIKAPFDLWMDILTGKMDGAQAFMEQKYTAEGDMNLLMNMTKYFTRGEGQNQAA